MSDAATLVLIPLALVAFLTWLRGRESLYWWLWAPIRPESLAGILFTVLVGRTQGPLRILAGHFRPEALGNSKVDEFSPLNRWLRVGDDPTVVKMIDDAGYGLLPRVALLYRLRPLSSRLIATAPQQHGQPDEHPQAKCPHRQDGRQQPPGMKSERPLFGIFIGEDLSSAEQALTSWLNEQQIGLITEAATPDSGG